MSKVAPKDAWETGVFYRGEFIQVNGLICWGEACVIERRVPVWCVLGHIRAGDDVETTAHCYHLTAEQVRGVLAEWEPNKAHIRRMEARAMDWCAGWWAGKRRAEEAVEKAKVPA